MNDKTYPVCDGGGGAYIVINIDKALFDKLYFWDFFLATSEWNFPLNKFSILWLELYAPTTLHINLCNFYVVSQ